MCAHKINLHVYKNTNKKVQVKNIRVLTYGVRKNGGRVWNENKGFFLSKYAPV